MRTSSELNESDALLIASPAFDAIAGLFADGKNYGALVNYGYGEPFTPVMRSTGEIDSRARSIKLGGEYMLTRETIGIIQRRGFGKLVVPADALEMLRKVDIDSVQEMRNVISSLVKQNEHTFGRSLFK